MWSIEAAIARHESIVMEQQQQTEQQQMEAAAAAGSGVAAPGAAQSSQATAMKVVVAVDASEESLHALSWALDHVVRFHPGASVVVLHAQHGADHFVYPIAAHGLAYAPPTSLDAVRKDQEELSSKVVSRALDVCNQKQASRARKKLLRFVCLFVSPLLFFFLTTAVGVTYVVDSRFCHVYMQVNASAVVVEGDPKEAICQAAEVMHAGLLVLGSRGLGMIKRY